MGRQSNTKQNLDQALSELSAILNNKEASASVVKGSETRATLLSDLYKMEVAAKESETVEELRVTKEELNALKERWGTLTPEQVKEWASELNTLKHQLDSVRSSNQGLIREQDVAKAERSVYKIMLSWMVDQTDAKNRLNLAVKCFCEKHAAGRVAIDALMGADTTATWLKVTHSKAVMSQKVRDLKHSVDADDQALVAFLLLYGKEKYNWDIEEQIKQENLERARRENESDRLRGERQQAMEVARNSRMRSDAREFEIMRTEAGLDPVSRVTPEYI
jgi:hypothetical protein